MGVMEIVLIILGIVVFILSYLLPAGKKNDLKDSEKIYEEAIKEMVDKEMEGARSRISDIVEETITYSIEKTERSLDRLTNEKMMAVNEYSDTVLEEIHKNHKEVVFLYDMLNDKHENLKKDVSEAVKTANDIKQTVRDAEITAREVQESVNKAVTDTSKEKVEEEFIPISPVKVEAVYEPAVEEKQEQEEVSKKQEPESSPKKARKPKAFKAASKELSSVEVPKVEVDLNVAGKNSGRNNNERILELHGAGKSNMAIAKELGLGIGEVKLVIDLFEGI